MHIQPNWTAQWAIALSLGLAVSCTSHAQERPRWETIDVGNGMAVSRIVLPHQNVTLDQANYMETACVRGTEVNEFTLQVSFGIPRKDSGLPTEMAQMDRYLGAQCHYKQILAWFPPSWPAKVTFRAGHAAVTLDMLADINFRQSDEAIARRMEPPCEIRTHSLHPTDAKITASGMTGTRVSPVLDLLSSTDATEVAIEIAGREERQRFPLLGAAAAIAQAKRICTSP